MGVDGEAENRGRFGEIEEPEDRRRLSQAPKRVIEAWDD
jgi:hypothetical protein